MREVKFRIWDFEHDCWSNPAGNDPVGPLPTFWHEQPTKMGYESTTRFIYLQYTGLKDKTGREIYEGDIMQGASLLKDFVWVVEWIPEHAAFSVVTQPRPDRLKSDGSPQRTFDAVCEHHEYCEVLGNLYEHPHLLKALNA